MNPGIGPDWLIPGGRPKSAIGFELRDPERTLEVVDGGPLDEGMTKALLPVLTLRFPSVWFGVVLDVDEVERLGVDVLLGLDLTYCNVGVAEKWIVDIFGLADRLFAEADTAAVDPKSATLFIPVGARPHLFETQPPTLPIRPRPPWF